VTAKQERCLVNRQRVLNDVVNDLRPRIHAHHSIRDWLVRCFLAPCLLAGVKRCSAGISSGLTAARS
jgi:hypothetical protein